MDDSQEINDGQKEDKSVEDNWSRRDSEMICKTCISFVEKLTNQVQNVNKFIGRCRKHAPTITGFPVVFSSDWCGDHKIDENKI